MRAPITPSALAVFGCSSALLLPWACSWAATGLGVRRVLHIAPTVFAGLPFTFENPLLYLVMECPAALRSAPFGRRVGRQRLGERPQSILDDRALAGW